MNAIHLLLGLLVLAYVGSILVGGRTIRGYGLPSGSEYLVLGFVLGPHALGILDNSTVKAFEAIVQAGLCWLALIVGLDYGFIGEQRIRLSRIALGLGLSVLSAALVGSATYLTAVYAFGSPPRDALLTAIGLGAVSSETTRHAVRWVALRYGAQGPVSDLVHEVADAADAIPLLTIAALFALAPASARAIAIPAWAGIGLSIGVGLVLGALVASLIRRELRPTELWGLLLGSLLLGIGTLTRVGLSALTASFAMGLALTTLSRHRHELRYALTRTEHAVLLPVLMLAGAHLTLSLPWQSYALVGVALAARLLSKLFGGALLRIWAPARKGGVALGLGLMPSGALTLGVGLACAFRLPGDAGMPVLVAAAACVLFGELVGPLSLRRALVRVAEIQEPAAEASAVAEPESAAPPERVLP